MKIASALALLLALVPAQEPAKSAPVDTKIRRVTVYPDRSLVTREARLPVPAGTSMFVIRDLPAGVMADSVRARILGADAVRLRGLEVKTYQVEKAMGDRVKELAAEREKLQEAVRAVQDRLSALASRREFVLSIKATVAHEASAAMLKEKPKIEDLKSAAAFVEESLLEIAGKSRQADREKRELEDKLRVLQDEAGRLTGGAPLTKRAVTLTLEAPQAAAAGVEVSYVIVGAGWVPFYDIHAKVEGGEATILYYGQILQATGEDWTGVELSLSTAHPARSARMPDIRPMAVTSNPGKGATALAQAAEGNRLQRNWQALNQVILSQNDAVYNRRDYQSLEIPAEACQAQMSSHVFRIKTAETIPSDGSPHKVTIAQSNFRTEVERVATPKLSAHVFLRTQVHNTSDSPYMPGDMNLFLGNDFIGSGTIELVASGERFEVFLGADEGVKVTRRLESRKVEAGTLQKAHYVHVIKIENFKAKATKVTVIDQLPVSRDSDVEVIADADLTAPTTRGSDGRLTWDLEIEPGKSKDIRLGYRIYYPANRPIFGLD